MVFNLNPALLIPLGLGFFWLLALSFFLLQTVKHYNRLTRNVAEKDLKSVLENILQKIGVLEKEIKRLTQNIEELQVEEKFHVQKVGLLRFNPFGDTGGDQSFVLALLDGQQNGVVISSLHGRLGTRWYAKRVEKGQGLDYELSDEEKKAIKLAQKVNRSPVK